MSKKSSNFKPSMTLTQTIWQTVNRGLLTPEQLQDEIDYSASSLKRAGIDGEAGAGFNLRKLIPLMKSQDDYAILECLAYRCGYLLIRTPRSGKSKNERRISVAEYQKLTAMAVGVLVKFIDDGATKEEAEDILHDMLKGTAEMIEDVKKGNQIEMDFEGESVRGKVKVNIK